MDTTRTIRAMIAGRAGLRRRAAGGALWRPGRRNRARHGRGRWAVSLALLLGLLAGAGGVTRVQAAPAGRLVAVVQSTLAGLAVGGNGAVYVADLVSNEVLKETPNGSGGYTPTTVASGLGAPQGVAVDSNGVVYIADTGNNQVLRETPNGSGGYTPTTVASGLNQPSSLAVDSNGAVYVADSGDDNVLKETPDGSGGYTQSTLISTLGQPFGVAVDGSDNLYVAYAGGVYGQTPGGSIINIPPVAQTRGVALDSSGNLYIADAHGVDQETPDGSGGYNNPTTVVSGLSQASSIAVDRGGAVYVADAGANQVFKETPNGSGGYTPTTVASGPSRPRGLAVDSNGVVYIANTGNNQVLKETPDGSGGYIPSTPVSGLNQPYGLALDGSGTLYIADTGNNRALKETPTGSGGYTPTTVASGLGAPQGVAVDSNGVVYIANTGNNQVLKETPDGSGGYTPTTVASGLNQPFGVAVDSNGDVYIADTGNNQVLKETPDGSGGYTQSIVASGLGAPQGVAVDSNGDVYIADSNNNQVLKEAPDGSGGYTQDIVVSGLHFPEAVALDNVGNLYVLDSQEALAYTLPVAPTQSGLSCTPSPLTYGSGSTTCTATVTDLSATPVAPSGPVTLTLGDGSGAFTPASGACTLAPLAGRADTASCTVDYTPARAGTAMLTADYGGDSTHTNSRSMPVPLQVSPAPLTITANDKSMTYGSAVPLSFFDASYAGFVNGDSAASLSNPPQCQPAGSAARLPVGTYAITCTGAQDPNYTISYKSGTLTITPASLTITANDQHMTYGGTAPAFTVSYSGLVTGDSGSVVTGLTCGATDASGQPMPVSTTTPVGTYAITCSGGTAANYSIAYQPGTLTIAQAAQAITITSTPPSPAAVGTTYVVSATGGASGQPVTVSAGPSGVCTSGGTNGATISFVGAGACTITATQAGDPDYLPAPAVTQTVAVIVPLALDLTLSSSPPGAVTTGSVVTLTATLRNNTALTQTVRLTTTLSYVSPWAHIVVSTARGGLTLGPGQTLGHAVPFRIPWWFPRGTYTLTVQAADGSGDTASGAVALAVT